MSRTIASHPPRKFVLGSYRKIKPKIVSIHTVILSLILLLTFTFGVIGLDYGLPYFPKFDNEPLFMKRAGYIAALNHPTPHWFGHPGSTLIYPLAAVYKIWGTIAYRIPPWETNPELFELLKTDPAKTDHFELGWADRSAYVLLGRGLNLFFFMGGIVTTYLVGSRVWDKRAGLLAAWFLAISAFLVEYAHAIRSDHVGLLFYMLAFLACFRLLTRRKWQDYIIAGAAIGIAGSSRYFNLSLGATLILAHFLAGGHKEVGSWKRLFLGLLSILGGFLLTTPAFLFSLDTVYLNLAKEARNPADTAEVILLTYAGRVWWYLTAAFSDALSWPVWLISLGGLIVAGWQRQNKKAILLAFGLVVYVLTISVPRLYWERWIIPIIPLGALFAARLVWTLVDTLVKRRYYQTWPARLIAVLVILTLSIIPLKETIQQACVMTYPDTRTLATEWIGSHVPAGSRVVRERYTAFVPDDQISVKFSYYLHKLDSNDADETLDHYDYAVASSWAYERFYKAASLCPEEVAFYDRLFENELVAEFQPDPWKRPGPTVRVYHLARNTSPFE